jgi:hypothetical protein
VLFIGAIAVIAAGDTASKLAVAGLTGIGGAISGYIGQTFRSMHQLAQRQLNFYYVEPLVTGYLLNAERLIEDSESQSKDALYQELVDAVLDTAKASLALGNPPTDKANKDDT